MKKAIVTFQRTYEVPLSIIDSKIIKYLRNNRHEIKNEAERIAKGWFTEELPEFINSKKEPFKITVKILDTCQNY
jgi:hypothetical protein